MRGDLSVVTVNGHLKATDDLGNVLIDQSNAVHPQNLARIFARALSHEENSWIYRIAFGNGGTIVDSAMTVTYRPPNDGQLPDINTWDSRLYNETYSEIVDTRAPASTANYQTSGFGSDPGSADVNTGFRAGGGAAPLDDPGGGVPSLVSGPGVRSADLGLTSQAIVTCVLNANEPVGQKPTDVAAQPQSTEESFVFDEIGLYTSGAPALATSGYQYVPISNKTSADVTGLVPGGKYCFDIIVDNGTQVTIKFVVPVGFVSACVSAGSNVLYGDLCQAINTSDPTWGLPGPAGPSALPGQAIMSITDYPDAACGGLWTTIYGKQTYGFLKIESATSGTTSMIKLVNTSPLPAGGYVNLFDYDNPVLNTQTAQLPPDGGTPGTAQGVQNNPTDSTLERERLLTHLIFSPVIKTQNRTITVVYTLTVSVQRTPQTT